MLSSDRVVNGLLVIGALVFILFFVSFSHMGWKVVQHSIVSPTPPRIEQGKIGDEGTACGGAEHLPCKPGFICDTDDDQTYGRCVKDEREVFPLGEEGATCDELHGCAAPFVCNGIGAAPGVCAKVDAE